MGSINGAFALAAFVGGLFCRRLKAAAIVGSAMALLYALLVAIGLRNILADVDLPYFLGALTGSGLVILVFALLGSLLRRGIAALFRRRTVTPPG